MKISFSEEMVLSLLRYEAAAQQLRWSMRALRIELAIAAKEKKAITDRMDKVNIQKGGAQ